MRLQKWKTYNFNANALAAQKTNAESGNQKLLDLGLTQRRSNGNDRI